ncbi:hypothetical protein EH223_12005 [candidate division KSB1 bacterium]|nr:hypothetical protein [candidate division KSB1 bacterium]RQW02550.1 MAG: hypothetical protein EH223_12005 [candidate division KSB1 bacterium]
MTKEEIKNALRAAIKKGYHPCYDLESEEEHAVHWMALTMQEFQQVWHETKREMEDEKKKEHPFKDLDEIVLEALKLHSSYDLPILDFGTRSRRLVVASGNALPTGRIFFKEEDAIFANEDQYKSVLQNIQTDGAVVISASGSKHAPIIIQDLLDAGLDIYLLTCAADSPAAVLLPKDHVYVTKQIKDEPITYNTSTYLGMILAKTKEDPQKIMHFIINVVEPRLINMACFDAFYLMIRSEFNELREMFVTKFDELFGPKVTGRCYTLDQTLHAKTVVTSESELFISFGLKNELFGHENSRLNIPLFDGAGPAAMIAITYYVIGKIQKHFEPWFKTSAEAYKKLQPELFKIVGKKVQDFIVYKPQSS